MTRDGIYSIRQRLMQQNQYKQYTEFNQRSGNSASPNPYPSSQRLQQQHFTDL
jgi:hypothetical protein